MDLNRIRDALLTVSDRVSRYHAVKRTAPYLVWAEDGQADALWADGVPQEQAATGTVDLFTRTEEDPLFDAVQQALTAAELSWRWNSTQREEDTGLIHHEWVWELG